MIIKTWTWFNGKKTLLGAIITAAAYGAAGIGIILPAFGVDAIIVAKYAGIATMILGIMHKAYKYIYGEEHN